MLRMLISKGFGWVTKSSIANDIKSEKSKQIRDTDMFLFLDNTNYFINCFLMRSLAWSDNPGVEPKLDSAGSKGCARRVWRIVLRCSVYHWHQEQTNKWSLTVSCLRSESGCSIDSEIISTVCLHAGRRRNSERRNFNFVFWYTPMIIYPA